MDPSEKCELCGKSNEHETKSDHLRTIFITSLRDKTMDHGYFTPRRISDWEIYALGSRGEHKICSNRKACQKRHNFDK